MKKLTARRVRHARHIISKDACLAKWGTRHHWSFDGYFWHRCVNCGRVS